MRTFLALSIALSITACTGQTGSSTPPGAQPDDGAAGTRPAGEAQLVTVEGRIEQGVECNAILTPDGETWAINFTNSDVAPGDYVRVTAEIADASYCMEGRGTLIPQDVEKIEPPARDRDPARAGGIELTTEYVTGSWAAKGVDADCDDPDFSIKTGPAGTVLNASISDHDDSALVILDNYPRIDLDEPMDDLPIESRGPDGLAILRPATDREYDPITIGSATIEGDGVVFVKCSDG